MLRGNLCPQGAIVKPAAASPDLLVHTGPALVFDSIEDFKERVDDPDLDVVRDTVMVLRGCGPRGYPGMPEVGNMPLPAKLLAQGVEDMVRISDARMSGTAFGTTVLHVAPESTVGGPLALVRTGDSITLDVPARRLTLDVDDAELTRRRAEWQAPPPVADRGWYRLYIDHVTQADTGCDLDFLVGASGSTISARATDRHCVPRPRRPLFRLRAAAGRSFTGAQLARSGGVDHWRCGRHGQPVTARRAPRRPRRASRSTTASSWAADTNHSPRLVGRDAERPGARSRKRASSTRSELAAKSARDRIGRSSPKRVCSSGPPTWSTARARAASAAQPGAMPSTRRRVIRSMLGIRIGVDQVAERRHAGRERRRPPAL